MSTASQAPGSQTAALQVLGDTQQGLEHCRMFFTIGIDKNVDETIRMIGRVRRQIFDAYVQERMRSVSRFSHPSRVGIVEVAA